MAERGRTDLEAALRMLAPALELPPVPDLAGRVVAELRSGAAPPRRRPGLRLVLTAAVTLVALAGAVVVFSPSAREAVADLLGIGGVSIRFDDGPLPEAAPRLDLGEQVSLGRARDLAPFRVEAPAALGPPGRVYFDERFAGGAVSFAYEAGPGLPRDRATGLGALLTQFGTPLDGELVKKLLSTTSSIERVEVDGAEGYWIEGPHAVFFEDADRVVHFEDARLAGNTLLWADGGITYRLETAAGRGRALEIASSLR